jgi:hypothetical protein
MAHGSSPPNPCQNVGKGVIIGGQLSTAVLRRVMKNSHLARGDKISPDRTGLINDGGMIYYDKEIRKESIKLR